MKKQSAACVSCVTAVGWIFTFTAAASNIVRLRRLLDVPA
jgi:hypothetical protein